MDDSELVEFLLNDNFNKEKTLLNQSLENEQKEIIDSSRDIDSKVEPEKVQKDVERTTGKNTNISKQISNTESEFLDDLDSIIMSTNNSSNQPNDKNKNETVKKGNDKQKKNKKDQKSNQKEEKSPKAKSLLQKLNDRLETKFTEEETVDKSDSIILVNGTFQSRVKLGKKIALVTIQILDNETGKVDKEERFKISNSKSVLLVSEGTMDKNPVSSTNEALTDLLNPKSNSKSKDSFKFKFTEPDMEGKNNIVTEEKVSRRNRTSKRVNESKSNKFTETSQPIEVTEVEEPALDASTQNDENSNKVRNRKRKERKRRGKELAQSNTNHNSHDDEKNKSYGLSNERIKSKNTPKETTFNKENKPSNNRTRDNKENDFTDKKNKSLKRSNRSRQNLKKLVNEKVPADEFKRTAIEF